jgi:hypothetical protein
MEHWSIDVVAVIVQCCVLIFFLGRFSEKIANLEKSNQMVISKLDSLSDNYMHVKDGNRIDLKLDAAWIAIDHIKEQMIPNLKEVIIKTIEEHKASCNGYKAK